MTRPINIADFAAAFELDAADIVAYEQLLSGRKAPLQHRKEEIDSLACFVQSCEASGPGTEKLLDGFAYSYAIPQISKEFDLLKIAHNRSTAINIELKSQIVDMGKVQKQLLQNQHYLSPVIDNSCSYCFCGKTKQLFVLGPSGALERASLADLKSQLCNLKEWWHEDLDQLFRPVDYLVSPFNDPTAFLAERYFLTNVQERIKKGCLTDLSHSKTIAIINGKAGTGKSLLAYDLARHLGSKGRVCVVHCGFLCEGHKALNQRQSSFKIISARSLQSINQGIDPLESFEFVIVDEAQRLYPYQLNHILTKVAQGKLSCILCTDGEQVLSAREKDRNLAEAIEKAGCAPSFHELTNKIRTNPELAAFVRVVFDLKTAQPGQSFDNVRIINAKSALDAHRRLALLEKDGFKPIPLTSSKYYSDSYGFGLLDSADWDNSHVVIGQEFDKVAVAAGPNFYYDDKGVLRSKPHPCSNYIAEKLLFQAMTRARRDISLVIYDNLLLFKQLLTAMSH